MQQGFLFWGRLSCPSGLPLDRLFCRRHRASIEYCVVRDVACLCLSEFLARLHNKGRHRAITVCDSVVGDVACLCVSESLARLHNKGRCL